MLPVVGHAMNGELAYKDIHGRVWRIRQPHGDKGGWNAVTLDIGHTVHSTLHRWAWEDLLPAIDREEFTTDGRSAQPLETGEGGSGIAETGRESQPESIAEISFYAGEIDGHEFPRSDPGAGPIDRGE